MKNVLKVVVLLTAIVCCAAAPALAKTPDDTDPLNQEGGPVDFGLGGSGSNRERCWQCIDSATACVRGCNGQPDFHACLRMCETILVSCKERYGC